jgi:hypothetical protein
MVSYASKVRKKTHRVEFPILVLEASEAGWSWAEFETIQRIIDRHCSGWSKYFHSWQGAKIRDIERSPAIADFEFRTIPVRDTEGISGSLVSITKFLIWIRCNDLHHNLV